MLETVMQHNGVLLMVLISVWVLPWKGWALWLASRRGERWWFIILLVLNTLAVLEIIYIFAIAKRSDTKEDDSLFEDLDEDDVSAADTVEADIADADNQK